MCGRSVRVTSAPARARAMPTTPACQAAQDISFLAFTLPSQQQHSPCPPKSADARAQHMCQYQDQSSCRLAEPTTHIESPALCPLLQRELSSCLLTCPSAEIYHPHIMPGTQWRVAHQQLCQHERALPHHQANVVQGFSCPALMAATLSWASIRP